MLATIVVGVDHNPESRDAIALARQVADAAGASLLLVHAYPYELLPLEGTVTEVEVFEDLRDDAAAFAAGLRDELAPGAATRVLPDTSPGRALHDVCEEAEAGLLVLGSHRRGADGRAAAGGTAKAALHHAPCPVLVTPRGAASAERFSVSTIGVGFDGSPEAVHALGLAREVAQATGGEIVLLTAVAKAGKRRRPGTGWPTRRTGCRSRCSRARPRTCSSRGRSGWTCSCSARAGGVRCGACCWAARRSASCATPAARSWSCRAADERRRRRPGGEPLAFATGGDTERRD